MKLLHVTIHNRQRTVQISRDVIVSWVSSLLKDFLPNPVDEVIIHFVTKQRMCALHYSFFQKDTPTDCISLPLDDPRENLPYKILGEIFVCPKVALEYATKHQKEPERETTLYIIHALLHLLGFNDLHPQERRKMRSEEKRCLNAYDCRLR